MKLIYCKDCQDMVKLRLTEMRFCMCGKVYGRYIDNTTAEVSKTAISIAIGNGSLAQAIQNMELFSERQGDELSRESYQNLAPINYAWVRPNNGAGNPHTTICDVDIRPMELVDVRIIHSTNTKLNDKVVDEIVTEGWKPEKGKALPAWWDGEKFIITDGNHRLEALKRMGEQYAPVVQLTKEEFDKVKFSKRHVDFHVHIPDTPRMWMYTGKVALNKR